MSTDTVLYLLPELLLVVLATGIYLAGTWLPQRGIWSWIAGAGLIAAGALLIWNPAAEASHTSVLTDALATFGRGLALGIGLLWVLQNARGAAGPLAPEFFGTLLLLVSGLMLVAAAGDLLVLFLGLELVTIPTYVLLYLARRGSGNAVAAQEAAAKYFYLSILSAAVMLYGFSFLYGATGELTLEGIRNALSTSEFAAGKLALAQVALVMLLAGLGFKITAVPFHFYAPDVYEGTSNSATSLLAVAPKLAGFVALARTVSLAMPGLETEAWRLAWILAVVTMTWGNVMALWQNNFRRLLAYSSIAHGGYILIGIAVGLAADSTQKSAGGFDGLSASFFYLAIYAIATVGLFSAATYLGRDDRQINHVEELAGLGRTQPTIALAMTVFLFSLAGIPPLAGFWGKLLLFGSALDLPAHDAATLENVRHWALALAIIGVLNAAIAATYYLRLIGLMYFHPPLGHPAAQGGRGAGASALICAVLVVGLGLFPGWLRSWSAEASQTARRQTPILATDRPPAAPALAADKSPLPRPPDSSETPGG